MFSKTGNNKRTDNERKKMENRSTCGTSETLIDWKLTNNNLAG